MPVEFVLDLQMKIMLSDNKEYCLNVDTQMEVTKGKICHENTNHKKPEMTMLIPSK